jgi:hypothetical protein
LAVGTCTVTASQAGNATFNAAPSVTRSFSIAKGTQTISFAQPASQVFATGKLVALPASASSGLAVTRTSLTLSVCTISATSALLKGAGICTVSVSQVGNANFNAATSVTRSFTVTAALSAELSALPANARLHEQGFASLAPFGANAVMAYASRTAAAGPFAILRQTLLGATGAPLGSALAVAPAAPNVGFPDVTDLTTGGHVIVWQGPDASGTGIFAQRFTSTGAKVGPIVAVNSILVGNQSRPRVAALPGGGFVVVWQSNSTATGDDIMMRRYTAAGAPLAPDARVNTVITRNQTLPDIASLATGVIAVTWASDAPTAGRFNVMLRLFNGTTGAALNAADVTGAALSQVLNPAPVLTARTGTGTAAGFALAYAQAEVAAAASPADIAVKTVTPVGVPSATALKANSVTAGHQANAAIAPLKGGGFAVAFTTPDASAQGIGLRQFSASGAPLGTEERVNTITALTQTAPALTPSACPALHAAPHS